ncbi:MAG TPA: ROK family protein [Conexibacter sp.]|nr:ROK family protein [Conexibacter sp.]
MIDRIESIDREEPVIRFLRVVHRAGLRRPDVDASDRAGAPEPVRLTHVEVARRAGLSRPSVASYVRRMRGSVLRSDALAIQPSSGYAIGVDFASAHRARVVVADMNGKIVGSWPHAREDKLAYQRASEALDSAEEGIAAVLRTTRDEHDQPIGIDRLIGVGISVPGPAQLGGSDERTAPWRHLRADVELKRRLGWRAVEFTAGNDAYLSALAESLWGGATSSQHVLYLKWAAGVRAAPIVNGVLYEGSAANAGEFSHQVVSDPEPYDEPCRCGQPGCIHSVTCLRTLLRAAELPDEALAETLVKEARAESGPARRALERAARGIGDELAPFIDLLNPELVVIGGPVGSRAFPLVLGDLVSSLGQHYSANAQTVSFISSQLNERTAVRGAVGRALLAYGPDYLRRRAAHAEATRRRAARAPRATREQRITH